MIPMLMTNWQQSQRSKKGNQWQFIYLVLLPWMKRRMMDKVSASRQSQRGKKGKKTEKVCDAREWRSWVDLEASKLHSHSHTFLNSSSPHSTGPPPPFSSFSSCIRGTLIFWLSSHSLFDRIFKYFDESRQKLLTFTKFCQKLYKCGFSCQKSQKKRVQWLTLPTTSWPLYI